MLGKGRGFLASILLVMSILSFTGCKNGGLLVKSPDMNVPFQSEVKVQAKELEFEGTIKRYGTGLWSMTVTSPETLAGLNITYNDESVTAELDGLTLEIDMEDINSNAVFAQLFKAVDSAAAAESMSCTETEDGKVFTGEFSGGEYKLTFEPQTLAPVSIEIPSSGIFCELRSFSIIAGSDISSETEAAEQTSQPEETASETAETTVLAEENAQTDFQ